MDIADGYTVVQSCHAAVDFQHEFPEVAKKWKQESNSIIVLGVPNESELISWYQKIKAQQPCSLFFEPDIESHTSIAFYADENMRKKMSSLPLILKKTKKHETLD